MDEPKRERKSRFNSAKFFALKKKSDLIRRGKHKEIRNEVIKSLIANEFDLKKVSRETGRSSTCVENIARSEFLYEQISGQKQTIITEILKKMYTAGVLGDSFSDRKMLLEMLAPEFADSGVRRQRVANEAIEAKREPPRAPPTTPAELMKMIQMFDPLLASKEQDVIEVKPLEDMEMGVAAEFAHYTKGDDSGELEPDDL